MHRVTLGMIRGHRLLGIAVVVVVVVLVMVVGWEGGVGIEGESSREKERERPFSWVLRQLQQRGSSYAQQRCAAYMEKTPYYR